MELISIIMPVYNSEKYLKDAILSIQNQTYSNFELIAVDDGSTDNSLEILKEFASTDQRIKVFHKENKGISNTRNYGLAKSQGDYITFIDNDDEYLPNLLKDNLELITKYDADMVKFQKVKFYVDNGSDLVIPQTKEKVLFFQNDEIWQNFATLYHYGGTIWNIMYKADFLKKNNITFSEKSRHEIEDHRFNLDCYYHLQKIVLNPQCYYVWKLRTAHSTSGKFIYERFLNIEKEGNDLYKFLKTKNIGLDWTKVKVSYLINILVVMNYDNSGFNHRLFIKHLKELKQLDLFAQKCTKEEYAYLKENESLMRMLACFFFDKKCYNTVYGLSKLKLRKDIKKNNRRF